MEIGVANFEIGVAECAFRVKAIAEKMQNDHESGPQGPDLGFNP